MMRMAGMQPYFFPYIGYWQLIDAVDCFVLFDEAQYIKQGWVNRNRVLKPGGGWQYVGVPVGKHPRSAAIRSVPLTADIAWRQRLTNQLAHYKSKAPHFDEAISLVETALLGGDEETIGALNCNIVRHLCKALAIKARLVVSSQEAFDYSCVTEPDDWALSHALRLGATEVINPVRGLSLMSAEKFARKGIALSGLEPPAIAYRQGDLPFEPSLSIIDVLMFNGIDGTRRILSDLQLARELLPAERHGPASLGACHGGT